VKDSVGQKLSMELYPDSYKEKCTTSRDVKGRITRSCLGYVDHPWLVHGRYFLGSKPEMELFFAQLAADEKRRNGHVNNVT
jgi:hypothetical protein